MTQPRTPLFFSVSAESSPISAISLVFGWQTQTWPGLAAESRPVQPSSVSCASNSPVLPSTVKAGPASFWPGRSGRSSGGRTKSFRPIARIVSWMMPV